jgi:hypothetical protein
MKTCLVILVVGFALAMASCYEPTGPSNVPCAPGYVRVQGPDGLWTCVKAD